jgi:small subunit ribosomal protein S15
MQLNKVETKFDYKNLNIDSYRRHANDTGSSEVQISLFTNRILYLTEHLKKNKKDFTTLRSLGILVQKRKKIAKYLKRENPVKYQELINTLGLRKI